MVLARITDEEEIQPSSPLTNTSAYTQSIPHVSGFSAFGIQSTTSVSLPAPKQYNVIDSTTPKAQTLVSRYGLVPTGKSLSDPAGTFTGQELAAMFPSRSTENFGVGSGRMHEPDPMHPGLVSNLPWVDKANPQQTQQYRNDNNLAMHNLTYQERLNQGWTVKDGGPVRDGNGKAVSRMIISTPPPKPRTDPYLSEIVAHGIAQMKRAAAVRNNPWIIKGTPQQSSRKAEATLMRQNSYTKKR